MEAQLLATYIGWLMPRSCGGVIAGALSWLYIAFGGRSLVESAHGELRFTACMIDITTAVVGMILNLALFFAYHLLWPQGFDGAFDWPSALIALAAAVALLLFKRGVMEVLGACTLAGLLVHLALA